MAERSGDSSMADFVAGIARDLLDDEPNYDDDTGMLLRQFADQFLVLHGQNTLLRDTLAAIWLYVDWRYVTKNLTTEQRNLWADAIDNDPEMESVVERWWADDNGSSIPEASDG